MKGLKEFQTIYEDYSSLVRAVVFQIVGSEHLNDLVQETFVKIWKNRVHFKSHSNIKTWIYRIAVNTALDFTRSRRRNPDSAVEDVDFVIDLEKSAETKLSTHELIQLGLRSLSEDHRVIIILSFLQEQSISEISKILDVSEGTVKSRLFHAKKEFLSFLESKGARYDSI